MDGNDKAESCFQQAVAIRLAVLIVRLEVPDTVNLVSVRIFRSARATALELGFRAACTGLHMHIITQYQYVLYMYTYT